MSSPEELSVRAVADISKITCLQAKYLSLA